MNRRRFIGSCACCAFASCAAALLNKDKISNIFYNKNNEFINHFEVHINEHCNLDCKYCNHYSCIAQKEFYNLDEFKRDIKRMSFVFEERLADLHLLGGEPLLNPDINKYIKIARDSFSATRISVITNAILLDDMDKSFWKTLNENNVNIIPSLYPIKINWKSILDKAKKYSVGIYTYHDCKVKLTLENIENNRILTFFKLNLKEEGYKDIADDFNCGVKYVCPNMQNGKLYPCARIAYVRHLNKKFNTNFKITKDDYIDLYKVRNFAEVKQLILNTKNPFCKYCKHNVKSVKWENSKEHSLSEWT